MNSHTINKIKLDLSASDYNQALEYRVAAKHWATHALPILLNKFFDSLNYTDELIYVERIEIKINELPWLMKDETWSEVLKDSFKSPASKSETLVVVFQDWIFYLFNGSFQTNAVLKSQETIEKFVFDNWNYVDDDLFVTLRTKPLTVAFLKRLFLYHKKETTIHFISSLLRIQHETTRAIVELLTPMMNQNSQKAQQIITHCIEISQIKKTENVEKQIADFLQEQSTSPLAYLNVSTKISNSKSNIPNKINEDVVTYCTNAGLVLLFPFYTQFFKNCMLVNQNEFQNEQARITAIQSLHYLATGTDCGPEEDYIIPKLICGFAPEECISCSNNLSEHIKSEANALLSSVINHWNILKETSVDGLRETFLKRNGTLKKDGNQYTLQVSESGVDVLLNHLPWGFRNFKLPWMTSTIITEWY